MRPNRRCGSLPSSVFIFILAFLISAPSALSQALTIVQSATRSAGSSAAGYNSDFGTATTVSLNNPSYVVIDSSGNQFMSDTLNNCVRKLDTSGNITTVVGLAISGQSDTCNAGVNPTPTSTQGLYQPTGLAIDSSNRLYIADSKHNCVRMIPTNETGLANLTTVAGTCGSVPTTSVTPAPNGLAVDLSGNLYISVRDSATNIFQVVQHPASTAATNACLIAGAPSANVPTNCAGVTNGISLSSPSGLALNIAGDLFIADTANNCVRQVVGLASGTATQATAVGKCVNDGSGNPATAIQNPYGIAISPMQTLLISETNPNNIVTYTPGTTSVRIVAGLPNGAAGAYNSSQDGQAAVQVPLNNPRGIVFDSVAHLFVADSLNNIVRELSTNLHFPDTPVGSSSPTQPITFEVNQAVNLSSSTGSDYSITSSTCTGVLSPAAPGAVPNTCQVFVSFNPTRPGIRASALKITDSVSNTSLDLGMHAVGTGALSIFSPGSPSTIASSLASPTTISTDAAGNAYVLQTGTPNILKIPAGGGTPTPISLPGVTSPSTIALDSAGNWYVADTAHGAISRYGADGSVNNSYVTGLDTPTAVYIDQFNNLLIAQGGASHNVVEAYISGVHHVVAGSGTNTTPNGVPASQAAFVSPSAIVADRNGIIYITDKDAHRVYAIDSNGIIHFVAGDGTSTTNTQVGVATGTAIDMPTSLAIDAAGDLYIADQTTGNIYIVYTSSTTGSNIAVAYNASAPPAPNGPLNIALDGSSDLFISRNATSSVLEITYPNPTVNFNTLTVGNTSPVMVQNVTNVGTDNINVISPYSTSDPHFVVDSASTTCGTTILTGYACAIGFTFAPSNNITYNATSTIASNSFNTPQSITLTGIGKQVVTPTIIAPDQNEVYGQSFNEAFTFGGVTSIQPTGSITFMYGAKVLCTISGTLPPTNTATCVAPPSGLPVGIGYPVTYNYSGDSNYNPVSGVTVLTVTPAPLSIVVNNVSRAVGAPNPTFTGTLTGVVAGETILASYSTTATQTSLAGDYPITATLTAVAPASLTNYTVTNTSGTLHVGIATPVWTLTPQTEVYGQPYSATFSFTPPSPGAPQPTGTASFSVNKVTLCSISGTLPPTTTATCTASPTGLAVGTYTVAFNYSGDANYAPYSGTTTLVVTALANSLVINVNSAARVYGAANPAFSGTVTGVLPGDQVTVTYSTTATQTSAAGNYPIGASVSGTSASNYIATIHPGTLAITSASTTTAETSSSPSAVAGTNVTFTATVTASSGTASGTVNFLDGTTQIGTGTLNSSGVATFTTNALSVGSHTITAAFQANTNFGASSASLTQIITAAPVGNFTITAGPDAPFIRGAGTTVYQVTVTSTGGFTGQVTLTCGAGLPTDATCTFTTPTVTLTVGGSVSTNMSVTTTAADAKVEQPTIFPGKPTDMAPITIAAVLPNELTGLGFLFAGLRRRKTLGTQKVRLLLLIVLSLGILGLVGCGCPSTAFKTYTIGVTGQSVTFPTLVQSTSVVLSVGQQ